MYETILQKMILAGKLASEKIMEIYEKGFNVEIKEDKSPVTDADIASDKIIRETLSCFTDVAWLSEEDTDDASRLSKQKLFIIDPLDGTIDFVQKDGQFGINIAYVEDHKPVVAVVCAPAQHQIAYAVKGKGAYLIHADGTEERLHVSDKTENLTLVVSKTNCSKFEEKQFEKHSDLIKEIIPMGASTKAIYIASGKAEACIRMTDQTKEWDTCAPDLLITEAGGIFEDTRLEPFVYNRRDVYNHFGYVMLNRKENEVILK